MSPANAAALAHNFDLRIAAERVEEARSQLVYSVAPGAVQSIFHAGQIRHQVRFSEAQQRELLLTCQRSIYSALREVFDALVSFDRLQEQRRQAGRAMESLHRAT